MNSFRFDDDMWVTGSDAPGLTLPDGWPWSESPIEEAFPVELTTSIKSRTLPFYKDVHLVVLEDSSWPEGLRLCYLVHDGQAHQLVGTPATIYKINAEAHLEINQNNAIYYLSFYSFFTHGNGKPFFVIDSLSNPLIPEGIVDYRNETLENRSLRDVFREPKIISLAENGEFMMQTLIYYQNYIFFADMKISKAGVPDMIADETLVSSLPKTVVAPLNEAECENP